MRKLKSLLAMIMVLVMSLSLAACGCGKTEDKLQAQLTLGAKYLKAKEYDKAQTAYREALDMDKYSIKAYEGLITAMLEEEPVSDFVPEEVVTVINEANEAVVKLKEEKGNFSKAQIEEVTSFYTTMSELTENDPEVFVETMITGTVALGTESDIGETLKEKAPQTYQEIAAGNIVVGENSDELWALIEEAKKNQANNSDTDTSEDADSGSAENSIEEKPKYIGEPNERQKLLSGNVNINVPSFIQSDWKVLTESDRNILENLFIEYIPVFTHSDQSQVIADMEYFVETFVQVLRQDYVYDISSEGFRMAYIVSGGYVGEGRYIDEVNEVVCIQGKITKESYELNIDYVSQETGYNVFTVDGEECYSELSAVYSVYYRATQNIEGYSDSISCGQTYESLNSDGSVTHSYISGKYVLSTKTYHAFEERIEIIEWDPYMGQVLYGVDNLYYSDSDIFIPATNIKEISNYWMNFDEESREVFIGVCQELWPILAQRNGKDYLCGEWIDKLNQIYSEAVWEGLLDEGEGDGLQYNMTYLLSGTIGEEAEYVRLVISNYYSGYSINAYYFKTDSNSELVEQSVLGGTYEWESSKYIKLSEQRKVLDAENNTVNRYTVYYDASTGKVSEDDYEQGNYLGVFPYIDEYYNYNEVAFTTLFMEMLNLDGHLIQ